MRLERRDGYRLLIGGPVPPQADAITLGRLIIVRRQAAHSEMLLAHELVHVRQYGELGGTRFLARYVASYLRSRLAGYGHMAAYRRIPLEVEASWLSRVHDRRTLEPGEAGGDPRSVSNVRAPRAPVAVRLQDEAERLTREAREARESAARTRAEKSPSRGQAMRRGRRASTSRRRKRTSPPRR